MRRLCALLLLAACSDAPIDHPAVGGRPDVQPGADSGVATLDGGPGHDGGFMDAATTDGGIRDAGGPCPLGAACNPIVIDSFPFRDSRDTRQAPSDVNTAYNCAPGTDESGGEVFYELRLLTGGVVELRLDDVPGDSVDVDLHLLDDTSTCLARDNVALRESLTGGTYTVVVDTFVTSQGEERAGPYVLTADLFAIPTGDCTVDNRELRMFWTGCIPGASFQCEQRGSSVFLQTPATGPVVKEAHLVTTAEQFPGGWPASFTDGISNHYALSQMTTGYTMGRTEPWAPAGEGGSRFGQGATGRPLPVIEEAWYVNMFWRERPAAGTKMILSANGRSVVAAAGYETGPGSNTAIGGASEEIHDYLGTRHRSDITMGFAVDQTLSYGPIDCQ